MYIEGLSHDDLGCDKNENRIVKILKAASCFTQSSGRETVPSTDLFRHFLALKSVKQIEGHRWGRRQWRREGGVCKSV